MDAATNRCAGRGPAQHSNHLAERRGAGHWQRARLKRLLAVGLRNDEAGKADGCGGIGNHRAEGATAQLTPESELRAQADPTDPFRVELDVRSEHAAGNGQIELNPAAWRRRGDVDGDSPAREREAAVEDRRVHALAQIARRAAAETDDGQPWKPGALIELDIRVHGRAAVKDEAVSTHEHGWI